MPGAAGSFEITSMFGEANARSTSTTRAVRASVRASAIAVSVVPTSRALPITAMLRPPSPD